MSSSSERLLDGQTFGRYRIVRMLGEGGMGAVYEAVHTGLKKRFAIKTLLPSIAKNPEAQARFLREGEAASRINHRNVVDVTDVGTEGGIPYLVMEYLEGETLADFVARKGAVEVELAMDILVPVLSAVSAGHDSGVIHRDLKPANVFLARESWGERTPKVLDFGVSKIVGGENPALTGTMSVLGTASYMSPEQARGAKVVDATSDQYALGLIVYEMLTGTRAHGGDSPLEVLHKIATGTVPSIRSLQPEVPAEIDAVVTRMLGATPAERHPSLRAVAKAVLPFASERVRLSYRSSFDEVLPGLRPTGPVALPVALAGGTMILPDQGAAATSKDPPRPPASAGETRVLPKPADTTLGQGATETIPPAPAARSGKGRVAIVLAAVAAVAIVAVRLVSGGKSPEASHAAATKPVAPAEPVAEPPKPAPSPAAVALPENPPQPPAAVPPPAAPPAQPEARSTAHSADERGEPHGSSAKHHGHHAPSEARTEAGKQPSKPAERSKRGANNSLILD